MMSMMMTMMQQMMGGGSSSGMSGMGGGAANPAAATPAYTGTIAYTALGKSAQAGNVTVSVTPLTLQTPGTTLDFDVRLETHSVDLGVDLTQLAVLRTASGAEVKATRWTGGSGHHVDGTLSFPSIDLAGKRVAGSGTLTLLVRNLAGVPERTFTWDLP
jgi:hypothetical protein